MEYTNSQARKLIDEYIHVQRDRDLLADRLINGMVIEKLAEKYELSPRQTWNIIRKNEAILFKHMK
jgi:Mor family transcriptional regulator